MKRVLAVALSLFLMLALAACGGGSGSVAPEGDDGTSTAAPAGGASEAAPAGGDEKDTLTWVQGADVTSLDPHVGKETPAVMVTCNIFDTLLGKDENGHPTPCLAESWESVDELTWTFKLRQDVTFHDGTPMTSADVKFSLERAIASAFVSYVVDFIDTVTADDEYTVTIKTKSPYGPILANLAVPFTAIVPKAAVEADEDAFVVNPIGTGAFKFVEWKQGDSIKLEANENYWGGAPATKNLVMRVVPEAAQRLIALENGETDLAYEIGPNDLSKVRDHANLELLEAPSLSVFYLTLNTQNAPFDNVKVRQAIRYAIDKPLIVDSMLYGSGEPADATIPPAAFGYSARSKVYDYNLELAKELMEEAGYADGFTCELSVNDNPTRVEICQVVQSQLKEIGINVEIQVLEFGSWIDQLGTGEHEMSFTGWTCSTADADYSYYSLFHSSQTGYPGNDAFLMDPKVDELVEKGRESANGDERQAAYDELEEYLGDLTPYTPIYYSNVNVGASSKVQNFVVDVNGYHRLHGVSVAG
ncbi:ABC transporter substrate-binding protein [Ruminococcaceae bacterium OttesenSCG-928-D13]|nr:ABC transporter substrate-binding protein [Ruminococcaceae bacterium OttesenSCG-928-D13]